MPEGKGRQSDHWELTVKAAGTREEAQGAAQRARRRVAEWTLREGEQAAAERQSSCR